MHFSDLPDDIYFAIAEQLGEESDINVLSRSSRRLHQILNSFLYQYNIRYYNGWGMCRAIHMNCEAALLKFIAHGADVRALERVDEPFDRRHGENPYPDSEDDNDDNNRPPSPEWPDRWLRSPEPDKARQQQPQEKPPPPYRINPGRPPVFEAAAAGHVGIMKILLEHGVNPDARDSCGWTPLILASVSNRGEMVSFLLGSGVALNAYASFQTCALSIAFEFGATETAKILLAHSRINPDPCSRHQREQGIRKESALIYAIRAQDTDTVKLILDKGVDPRVIDEGFRRSSLCMAAETGNLAILRMLLEKGADGDLPGRDHFYSPRRYHAKVVQYLRKRAINSNTEVKDEQVVDTEMVNYIKRTREKFRRRMRRRRILNSDSDSDSDSEISDWVSD